VQIAIYIFSILTIVGTLLPLNKSKLWFVRDQVNFRAYYLVGNIFLLVGICILNNILSIPTLILLAGHAFCIFICIRSIKPYLFFSPTSIQSATHSDSGIPLKILIFNVLQDNDEYDKFLKLADTENPHIILLLETDEAWENALSPLENEYPHTIKEIRDDTYGIYFMSRVPFIEKKLNHFVSDDIPSIEALIKVGAHNLRIFGLHPEPPLPGEAWTSMPKNLEMLSAANRITAEPRAELDIVIGDLNDVGWSLSAKKFKEITGLKDPREGRGFYATFPTYLPFRIPIDHVFCSPKLKLIDFRTLENIGSDHFPVCVTFSIPDQ